MSTVASDFARAYTVLSGFVFKGREIYHVYGQGFEEYYAYKFFQREAFTVMPVFHHSLHQKSVKRQKK
jgi:hypothetical protein